MIVNDFVDNIHYETKIIDIGGGQYVYEYYYQYISFTSNNIIELSTKDN
jgi:hypothetical protein